MNTDWATMPLGEMLSFQRGFDITKNEQEEGSYPVISSSGSNSTHSAFKVKGPGVVIGRKGTLGTVFYAENDFWPHDTTLWVKDFHGNEPKFSYYFLRTLGLEQYDCGASNPTLNRNHIHTLPIRRPSIEVQRRVGCILSAYDDLIENNKRRIKILEQMAQMLYREWFVDFRFPGHDKVKMVESELGQIPATWSALPMNDVVTEIIDYRGKTPKKLGSDWANDGVIALSALNVKHGRLESLDKAKRVDDDLYTRWMKSELDEGDILMTSEAPLGEAYILTEKKKYCLSQRLFSIRANPKRILPSLLYLFLGSHGGQEQIKRRSTGTTVLGIRQSELRKVIVPIPESGVQQRLNSVIWPLLKQIDTLARKNDNLRKTRDFLLPKLVSGEIEIPQVERLLEAVTV